MSIEGEIRLCDDGYFRGRLSSFDGEIQLTLKRTEAVRDKYGMYVLFIKKNATQKIDGSGQYQLDDENGIEKITLMSDELGKNILFVLNRKLNKFVYLPQIKTRCASVLE